MAKWAGLVGFRNETESIEKPGVWVEEITNRNYYGDIIKNYRSLDNNSEINDGINVTNQISIISDPYAQNNFHKIIYVTYMGIKWKVKTVEVQYPRLLLSLGGTYNE